MYGYSDCLNVLLTYAIVLLNVFYSFARTIGYNCLIKNLLAKAFLNFNIEYPIKSMQLFTTLKNRAFAYKTHNIDSLI